MELGRQKKQFLLRQRLLTQTLIQLVFFTGIMERKLKRFKLVVMVLLRILLRWKRCFICCFTFGVYPTVSQKFDESIVYSEKDARENNFLAENAIAYTKYDYNTLLASSTVDFAKLVNEKKAPYFLKLNDKKLDPNCVIL
ncbi:hypothetical protein CXF59_13560 [Flavobacterium sp. ALD4]|nr:hypothetical protein CXF59_13560 [Flavobacterium sp. ALD4]